MNLAAAPVANSWIQMSLGVLELLTLVMGTKDPKHCINSFPAKSLHAPNRELESRAVRSDKDLSVSIPTYSVD